jgi:hypothetical protein
MESMSVRLEDCVMMFHEGCGGIVIGEIGKELHCAECGRLMELIVSEATPK